MANTDYDGIELRFSATYEEVAEAFNTGEAIVNIYAPGAGLGGAPVCQGKIVGLYERYSGALVEVPSRVLFNDTHLVFEGQPESYTIMFYETHGLPNSWMQCEFIWADYTPKPSRLDVTLTTDGSVITANVTTGDIINTFESGTPVFLYWPYDNSCSLVVATWVDEGTYHILSNDASLSSSSLDAFPTCGDY